MVAALIAPFHPTIDDVQGDASLVMVLTCWLGAIFTYLLSRRLGMGRGAALLATALLAFASPWLAYTRSFFSEPATGVAALIAFWALEGDRPATSALAASAAAFFKPPFAVIGVGFLIDRIEQKRWRDFLVLFSVLSVCGIALIAFNYWLARTAIISGNSWPVPGHLARAPPQFFSPERHLLWQRAWLVRVGSMDAIRDFSHRAGILLARCASAIHP